MRSRTKIAALVATIVAIVNVVVSTLVSLGVISQEVGKGIFDFLNALWGLLAALGLGYLRDAVQKVEDKVGENGSSSSSGN
jgi:small neutral amino acid transporter SnatA (MarC family)